jgi:hypothetical protein
LLESCFYCKKTPNLIKKLFLCFVLKPRLGAINSKHNNFKWGSIFAGICTLVLSLRTQPLCFPLSHCLTNWPDNIYYADGNFTSNSQLVNDCINFCWKFYSIGYRVFEIIIFIQIVYIMWLWSIRFAHSSVQIECVCVCVCVCVSKHRWDC